MAEPLVVIGAGGHGREVCGISTAAGWTLRGVVDDGEPDRTLLEKSDIEYLGTASALAELSGCAFVVAIGDGAVRRRIARIAMGCGLHPAVLIHPDTTVGSDVDLGDGSVVFPGVRLTTHIRVGAHTHINQNVTVAHDCVIGSYATISPGAQINGTVQIGDGVFVGSGATVIQGVTIGRNAVVGAGAVVLHDLPDGVTAVGVPARARI